MVLEWLYAYNDIENDFFAFNLKCLMLVGLWPDEGWSKRQLFWYKLYEITLHILSMTFITFTGIVIYGRKQETIILMTNLDKVLVAYNFVLKVFFFMIRREKLKVLVKEIQSTGDKVSRERRRLMVTLVLMITILSTAIISAFSLKSLLKGEMVVDAWMPFDPLKNKMNLLLSAELLTGTFALPCLYRAFALQGIVCSIVMYLCDQLVELQNRLRYLEYTFEDEDLCKREFKSIVKKHIRIMRYSHVMTEIFKEFFLIQNLAVTIELCMNALMVTIAGFAQKTLLLSFVAYLGLALFNAYIFCYLGNELIIQSEGIALAAYQSSWTSWPMGMQKDLLIVIRAAQKPLVLSAGGMATMCIQTYAQALYNAYSIFAVLNDVVD